jgi:hypothetical protein
MDDFFTVGVATRDQPSADNKNNVEESPGHAVK